MAALNPVPGLVILVHTFPLHSATFIANEVRELERQGVTPALVAIRPPGPGEAPAAMDDLARRTRYLLPVGVVALVRAHAAAFARRPGGYLRALGAALGAGRMGLRDRLRTLVHFGEAVVLGPILEDLGCRHLHVHALSGPATLAMLLGKMGGPPYSLTAHGTDIFVERVLLKEKIAGARFARVGTRFNRDHLVREHGADAARIHVLPFGVDVETFRPPPTDAGPAPDGALRIASVGRLVWQKAHRILFGACARLRRKGIALRLTIVGEGEERPALEALRARLGLDGVIDLAGAAGEDEVARVLARSDLFVLSSVSEGFGIVLLEAMACALPVIAPALNGLGEVVADGVEGRLVAPGSEEDLAAAIEALATDPVLRRRLGAAGRRRVVDTCRLQDRVAAFAELLRAAAAAP